MLRLRRRVRARLTLIAWLAIRLGALASLAARAVRLVGGLRRRLGGAAGLGEPLVQRALFEVQDLAQLLLDLLHRAAEVELIEALAALLPQLVEQVAQSGRARSVRPAHPALHQVAQRVLQVAEVHQVVGEGLEDVTRLELGDLLAAVPCGVARKLRHGPAFRSSLLRSILGAHRRAVV